MDDKQIEDAQRILAEHLTFLKSLNPYNFILTDFQSPGSIENMLKTLSELEKVANGYSVDALIKEILIKMHESIPTKITTMKSEYEKTEREYIYYNMSINVLLEHFNVNAELIYLLSITGGIIAGSAALAAATSWIKYPGSEMLFNPDNMNIFVQSCRINKNMLDNSNIRIKESVDWMFKTYLRRFGYISDEENENYEYGESDEMDGYCMCYLSEIVCRILYFKHPITKKEIRVIHTYIPVNKVIKTFDISVCATWIDGNHNIHTIDEYGIRNKEMYHLKNDLTKREIKRLKKYESRGFTLVWRDPKPVLNLLNKSD